MMSFRRTPSGFPNDNDRCRRSELSGPAKWEGSILARRHDFPTSNDHHPSVSRRGGVPNIPPVVGASRACYPPTQALAQRPPMSTHYYDDHTSFSSPQPTLSTQPTLRTPAQGQSIPPLAPAIAANSSAPTYRRRRRESSASTSTLGSLTTFSPTSPPSSLSTPASSSSSGPLECCGHAFVNAQTLRRHQREVSTCPRWRGPRPGFACIYCPTACKRKFGLKQHLGEQHPQLRAWEREVALGLWDPVP